MIHDKSIVVGACGWDHSLWQDNFYPEDLPKDWRLTYYANEFAAVLVPQEKWRAADVDYEQWAEDVPEDFRFYFVTDDLDADDLKIKKEMGNTFAGFVTVGGNVEISLINYAEKNLRGWKDWLLQTNKKFVFLTDDSLTVKQLIEFKSLVELMGK